MEITGKFWRGAVGGILLAFSFGAMAQNSEDAFVKAQTAFERGQRGSESDNEAASEQFKRLSETEADNPLFLAYYGSTITIKARDAWLPWKKLKLGEEGLDLIDKALRHLTPEHDKIFLRKTPLSIETRLVAIGTFLQMPDKYFHRYDNGKALLAETMNSPVFTQSTPQIQASFHYQAALVAQREGRKADEVAQLKQMLALDPQGIDANAAHARLKELGA